jgi:hypothetical protein
MKTTTQILILALLLFAVNHTPVSAQSLNPTIINGNVILCPGENETLSTQVYDAYQWLKNGSPVPGAIFQNHVVNYYEDAGYNFSVQVTQGGQSATSPSVLVDGWVFLPLNVSNYGSGFWFVPGGWQMCEYHELFFQVMMPYNTGIQWYRNGTAIPGANSNVYQVTETGTYTVSASPATCPNYVQYSIPLPVVVHVPPTPVIAQSADTLFTSVFPGQWYAGDNIIPGATGPFIAPQNEGWYSFLFTDENGCSSMSEPFYFEFSSVGIPENGQSPPPSAFIIGNKVLFRQAAGMEYFIFSLSGMLMQHGDTGSPADISRLSAGIYVLKLTGAGATQTIRLLKF